MSQLKTRLCPDLNYVFAYSAKYLVTWAGKMGCGLPKWMWLQVGVVAPNFANFARIIIIGVPISWFRTLAVKHKDGEVSLIF
jgi:hypothetical protein